MSYSPYLGNMIQFDWYSPEFFHTEHSPMNRRGTCPSWSPWVNDSWKMKFPFGMAYFQGCTNICFNWVEIAKHTHSSSGLLSQRMVSDIYWSNEMTSGASWLKITRHVACGEARDLPVNLSRVHLQLQRKLIQVVQKRNCRWWLYTAIIIWQGDWIPRDYH